MLLIEQSISLKRYIEHLICKRQKLDGETKEYNNVLEKLEKIADIVRKLDKC